MCLFLVLLALSPRIAALFWWLIEPNRWESAFESVFWPIFGIIFLPFTTIMWVAVAPFGNVAGYDWMWLGFALLFDVLSLAGGGAGRRSVPGYPAGY